MNTIQTIEAHGVLTNELRYQPDSVDADEQLSIPELITWITNARSSTHRYLVTLVHVGTGEEKHLDVVLDCDRFCDIAKAVRSRYGYDWEFLNWIDTEEPF